MKSFQHLLMATIQLCLAAFVGQKRKEGHKEGGRVGELKLLTQLAALVHATLWNDMDCSLSYSNLHDVSLRFTNVD